MNKNFLNTFTFTFRWVLTIKKGEKNIYNIMVHPVSLWEGGCSPLWNIMHNSQNISLIFLKISHYNQFPYSHHQFSEQLQFGTSVHPATSMVFINSFMTWSCSLEIIYSRNIYLKIFFKDCRFWKFWIL